MNTVFSIFIYISIFLYFSTTHSTDNAQSAYFVNNFLSNDDSLFNTYIKQNSNFNSSLNSKLDFKFKKNKFEGIELDIPNDKKGNIAKIPSKLNLNRHLQGIKILEDEVKTEDLKNDTEYHSFAWVVGSNICGVIYVIAWIASYYPQAYMNWKRKRVDGLSHDYIYYNIIGYIAYTIFTCAQFAYQHIHNAAYAVEPADMVFSINCLLITSFIGFQIYIYPRGSQRTGNAFQLFVIVTLVSTVGVLLAAICGSIDWINLPQESNEADFGSQVVATFSFIQFFGYLKSVATFLKYIPQVHLNYIVKSTRGMSVLNYCLDLTGGILSILQNSIDAYNYNDLSYIVGNIPKLIISLSSIFYDVIILAQHFYYKCTNPIPPESHSFKHFKSITPVHFHSTTSSIPI